MLACLVLQQATAGVWCRCCWLIRVPRRRVPSPLRRTVWEDRGLISLKVLVKAYGRLVPTRGLCSGTSMPNDWLGSGLAILPRYAANFLPTRRSCAVPLVCLTDYRFCCFNQGLLDFVRGSWVSVIPPQLCVVLNEISPLLGGALIDKRCQLGFWCCCSLHGAIPWLTLRRRMAGRFAGGTWM